jgi:hypothetical protein
VSARTAYLDATAVIALVLDEPAAPDLVAFLRGMGNRLTSVITRAEVARRVASTEPAAASRAAEIIARLAIIELDGGVVGTATALRPPSLGLAGAIHVASAQLLADSLDAFITYDPAIAAAARGVSLTVESPGVDLATEVAAVKPTRAAVGSFDPALVQRVVDRLVGRLRPGRVVLPDGAAQDGTLHLAMVPGPWSPGRGAIWIGQEAIEDLDVRLDLALVDEDTPEPPGRILYELSN